MIQPSKLVKSFVFGLCLITIRVCAQNKPELLDRMHRVTAGSSLDAPGVKPWHMKIAIQLYDPSGAPSEKGIVEQWWEAPGREKRVYTFPSFSTTHIRTADGFYRTPNGGVPTYLVDYVLRQVIHPMPSDDEIDKSKLDMRRETLSKVPFDCVMLTQPIRNLAYAPFGLFPTYCLDRDKDFLRVTAEFGGQVTVMNRKGVLRGVEIPLDLSVNSSGKQVATAHVEALQGREVPFPETQVTEGLEAVHGDTAQVAGGVVAGMIVKKVPPVYPQSAKDRHVSGSVVMRAIIGTDGHVHLLKPLDYPDPDLVISAIAAVRQWTYKPYLMDGVPTEVDTTITVNYKLSQ